MLRKRRRYAVGWMNYFGVSQAYRVIPELDQRLRRRGRMYYWKQWKRARTRRRLAGRSRVQRPLDDRWLAERGVPSLKDQWLP